MSNATQGLLLDPNILSEETLLKIYNKAIGYLLEGRVYMSFSGEGTEFTSKFPISVEQILSECSYALKQKNPAKYGNIVTQVKPIFV
jgi:hypothetical protein